MKFKPETPKASQTQILKANNATLLDEIPQIKVKLLKVDNENARDAAITALSHNPNVDFAEKNGIVEVVAVPNDPYFVNGWQWDLKKVQAPEAWDITTGSPTISIAVLDSGIELTHSDLSSKVVASVNFSSSATVADVCGHGTAVAGTVAAATNNSLGVASLGYNSTLMNVKVLDDNYCAGYDSQIAKGLVWAADNGARVVNMSFGDIGSSVALQDAVNYAWSKGVVLVAGAGNNGNTTPFYPAAYQNVIAVASTDPTDHLSPYSDYGDWVDVAAPGDSVWSTVKNNGYDYRSGTSMASPHVAGLAALVFTKVSDTNGDGLLNDEVRSCIEKNADNIGISGIGGGRINAYKAVLCSPVALTPTPTLSITPTLAPSPTPTLIPTATPIPTPTPVPGDTTPPTTSITSPLTGTILTKKSIITITADATDNIGVSKVEFYVGGSLKCADTTVPFYCTWFVPASPNKTYQLQTKAYDTSLNIGSSSIVTVTSK